MREKKCVFTSKSQILGFGSNTLTCVSYKAVNDKQGTFADSVWDRSCPGTSMVVLLGVHSHARNKDDRIMVGSEWPGLELYTGFT